MTQETTFCMIKPDAFAANQQNDILNDIKNAGFEIVKQAERTLTEAEVDDLYAEHKERSFYPEIREFALSGPVMLLLLSKENAVADLRALMGATKSADAAEGTIRAKYGDKSNIMYNRIHGSDSLTSAAREQEIFFKA